MTQRLTVRVSHDGRGSLQTDSQDRRGRHRRRRGRVRAAGARLGPDAPAGEPVAIRVGSNDTFTRVEFAGVVGARTRIRQDGRSVIARVGVTAAPDIARLRVDPPPGVVSVETGPASGATEVIFTLTETAAIRSGSADGAVFLNIYPEPLPQTPGQARQVAAVAVPVRAAAAGDRLTLQVAWPTPTAAAVFRRGQAVWLVFDAPARFDMRGAGSDALGPVTDARSASDTDFSVIRLAAPEGLKVSAQAEGGVWTIVVGGAATPAGGVTVVRDDAEAPALVAQVAGARRVVWLTDPMVGGRFAAVPAQAPAKGYGARRRLVDLTLLPTAHGLALEAVSGDLEVTAQGDLVRITRPGGLTLSPPSADLIAASALANAPRAAARPALVLADWSHVGEEGFTARLRQLQDAASKEATQAGEDPRAPAEARLALTRFLVGSGLSYEAIGVLNALVANAPNMQGEPEVRGLRGAARAMVGRDEEAAADLSAASVAGDPATEAWQGWLAARREDWVGARASFARAAGVVDQFPPLWRARFATAHARAAMETGDLDAAHALLAYALSQPVSPAEQLEARLVQAAVFEAQGQTDRALRVYQAIGRAPLDGLSAPALLAAARIELARGAITPDQAAGRIEPLRWRWRGDATELSVIRTLGGIYLAQGRCREALDALKGGGNRLSALPEAAQLQADLSSAFRALFLEGAADGLQPVQALALFYDFRELTPVGADGDEMVRRLSRRLIDVDLLDQAAELLKHQVDERLDGVAQAQVATDLATVYLMDRRPEAALRAIWTSRTTLLPTSLNAERRVLEARALMDLGRFEHALEVLGDDGGPAADGVRADLAWKQENWASAAALYDARLGDRHADAGTALSAEEESLLIRAAVGYSLARDDVGLARLSRNYGPFIQGARAPDAIRVALEGPDDPEGLSAMRGALARADTFAGWVRSMKTEMRGRVEGDRNADATPQTNRGGAGSTPAAAPSRPQTSAAA